MKNAVEKYVVWNETDLCEEFEGTRSQCMAYVEHQRTLASTKPFKYLIIFGVDKYDTIVETICCF